MRVSFVLLKAPPCMLESMAARAVFFIILSGSQEAWAKESQNRCHTDHGNPMFYSTIPPSASKGLHSTLPCLPSAMHGLAQEPQGLSWLTVQEEGPWLGHLLT